MRDGMENLVVEGDGTKPRKKWYTNVYVLMIVLVSLLAVSMAGLMLLLLPQSSEIVRIMQWRMVNAKSAYVEAVVDYQGDRQWKDAKGATRHRDEAVTLETSGWLDRIDPELPKARLKFDLKAGKTDPWHFAGDYARAGEANYFNFSALPERVGTLHFGEFMHRWLRIDVPGLLEITSLPIVGGERPELTDLDEAYLIEQFRKTPFLRVEEKLKAETLGGVRAHHYKVRPEVLFFKDYYVLAESIRLGGRELTNKERLAADAFFANVTAEDGELWIGVRDYYLYRMRLRFKYDDGARSGHFTVTANFSRFNEPSVMDVPVQGVDDVTDIVMSLLPGIREHLPMAKEGLVPRGKKEEEGGLPIDTNEPGDDDPDKDGLPNVLERFYGADPANPDTDGDGVNDGAEVDSGMNPTGAGRLFDFTGGRFE